MFAVAATTVSGVVLVGMALVDPFDNLPFSLDLPRRPVLTNQRYGFPGLARKARFDSALVGTSTSRLFRPEQLDALFDARFVNLSMNGSTDWEQEQLLDVFLRSHPRPRAVVLGLDPQWMQVEDEYEGQRTRTEFPSWMYDDDPLNDLTHLFSTWSVDKAVRQVSQMLGRRTPAYDADGGWTPPPGWGEHTPEERRRLIYEAPDGKPLEDVGPERTLSPEELADLRFPAHATLQRILGRIPEGTETIVFLAPYHPNHPNVLGGKPGWLRRQLWAEATRRIVAIVRAHPHVRLVDFQIDGPLTREDANWLDSIHTTPEATARMAEALAASRDAGAPSDLFVRRAP